MEWGDQRVTITVRDKAGLELVMRAPLRRFEVNMNDDEKQNVPTVKMMEIRPGQGWMQIDRATMARIAEGMNPGTSVIFEDEGVAFFASTEAEDQAKVYVGMMKRNRDGSLGEKIYPNERMKAWWVKKQEESRYRDYTFGMSQHIAYLNELERTQQAAANLGLTVAEPN